MQGWIKVHRSVTDNFLWDSEPFTKAQAWIDLLLHANFTDCEIMIKSQVIRLKRGEQARSEITLSKSWKWSRNKVRRFLEVLKNRQMIEVKTTHLTSIISICNYNSFQSGDTAGDTANGTPGGTAERQLTEHSKECKERKNVKKDTPTAFQFKKALIENGVDIEVAEAWLAIRKKKRASNTEFAFNKIKSQVEKSGLDFNSAIDYAASKDWKGFEAEWYLKDNPVIDLPYDEIMTEFNKLNNLADCLAMTNKRKALIAESWQQSTNHQNIKFWSSYFNYVSNNSQSFEEWQLGFDYLININHMIKIIEKARAAA